MSKQLITQYYTRVDKLIQFGGSKKETSVRNEFYNLLNHYAEKKNLLLVPELSVRGTKGKNVTPDGTVKNSSQLDYGYWESKDEALVLDEEIDKKIYKGYPLTNTLFEDSKNAVLFQKGENVMHIDMRQPDELDRILNAFFNYKSPFIERFDKALEQFRQDIPEILKMLREKIDEAGKKNKNFIAVSESFLLMCKQEINPEITEADVREMLIQHILTSDIFNKIFDDAEFHCHNNIANELEKLTATLFTFNERRNLLASIEHYYETINAAAANIADHHEKQKFLKSLYENFYKAYNPKAADRLGVVYTPNEIVRFMVESTDYLLEKHFNKNLYSKNVEILDPAAGTGTFVCEIIDYLPAQYLTAKYKNEIHANEVAILPYYIANLNIEFTFKQKMKFYEVYENLCFVDTLDNTAALAYAGKQISAFGMSSENTRRIKEQNKRKISVVIGNPPYNANQKNENENNKNREYPDIDKRIKNTYIHYSTAQKTKVYDMYARFYRWASDRVDKNGVVCFITNNSFVNARTFDGFRKCIESEFDYAYIIDLGGNIRELSGKDGIWLNEENTIFGVSAAVGIAMMWLVKKESKNLKKCQINYIHPCDIRATRKEKLEYLGANPFRDVRFEKITPDKSHNWLNIADTDFESLLPLIGGKSVFKINSLGVSTNRDEWVYDFDEENLEKKIKFFIQTYNEFLKNRNKNFETKIKWSSTLKNYFNSGKKIAFDKDKIINSSFRPFVKTHYYSEKILSDRLTSNHFSIFGSNFSKNNLVICINNNGKDFRFLVTNFLFDLHFTGDTNAVPLYRYDEKGNRIDNITDWGLEQFVRHYKDKKIKKEDIFHYTYSVLHHPAYRKKYELNLKREFPRLPFYNDFWKWAKWGKELMDLHINYEKTKPFPLQQKNYEVKAEAKRQKELYNKVEEPQALYHHQSKIKVKLKANKETGVIDIDELTFLTGVPKEAWEYKLGNRSALEWVLDQYKEKKHTDPTIAEKFNTYRFADYKDKVIDLLKRVCTVSVETMKIIKEMEKEKL